MFSNDKNDVHAHSLITRRTALQMGGAAAAFGLGRTIARADTYPDGPINVIIPLPPGGTLDVFARALQARYSAGI